MIRFVYFDASGTLLDPHPSVGEVYARACRPLGLTAPGRAIEEAFRAAWVRHIERCGPMLFGTDEEKTRAWWRGIVSDVLTAAGFSGDLDACFEACWAAFGRTESWRVYDDVAPALDALDARGIPKGVLSNWDLRLLPLLDALDLARRFDPILISSLEGVEKPDLRFFELAIARAGVAADEILYVGDQLGLDVSPALEIGMRARLIDRRGMSGHPLAIRSLTELLEL